MCAFLDKLSIVSNVEDFKFILSMLKGQTKYCEDIKELIKISLSDIKEYDGFRVGTKVDRNANLRRVSYYEIPISRKKFTFIEVITNRGTLGLILENIGVINSQYTISSSYRKAYFNTLRHLNRKIRGLERKHLYT